MMPTVDSEQSLENYKYLDFHLLPQAFLLRDFTGEQDLSIMVMDVAHIRSVLNTLLPHPAVEGGGTEEIPIDRKFWGRKSRNTDYTGGYDLTNPDILTTEQKRMSPFALMTEPNNDGQDSSDELSLIQAMKMADVARKHYHGVEHSSPSGIPPGALQGAAAFVLVGVALLPVRKVMLKYAGHKGFKNFVDINATVGGTLAATQVGLVVGSLYGSKVYLDLLKAEPVTSKSQLTDEICNTMWSTVLPPHLHRARPPAYSSLDPRLQPLNALQEAMEKCKARKEYQKSLSS
ncbi:MAG: hypothetical protein SGBAC_005021 [Bacillariaceae sp.]